MDTIDRPSLTAPSTQSQESWKLVASSDMNWRNRLLTNRLGGNAWRQTLQRFTVSINENVKIETNWIRRIFKASQIQIRFEGIFLWSSFFLIQIETNIWRSNTRLRQTQSTDPITCRNQLNPPSATPTQWQEQQWKRKFPKDKPNMLRLESTACVCECGCVYVYAGIETYLLNIDLWLCLTLVSHSLNRAQSQRTSKRKKCVLPNG